MQRIAIALWYLVMISVCGLIGYFVGLWLSPELLAIPRDPDRAVVDRAMDRLIFCTSSGLVIGVLLAILRSIKS